MRKVSLDEFEKSIKNAVEIGRLTYATTSYEIRGSDRGTDNIIVIRKCHALGKYIEKRCQYSKDEFNEQEIPKHCLEDLENLVQPFKIDCHKNFIKILGKKRKKN